jgi:methylmalonyl-CoA/ethylmalonyl-CoA epimerase
MTNAPESQPTSQPGSQSISQPALIKGIRQFSIVTPDFDRTLREMTSTFGFGPFSCWDYQHPVLLQTKHRGKESPWTMRLGFAWVGSMQLEVIQPVAPMSMYDEYLAQQPIGGVHHMLINTGGLSLSRAVKRFAELGHSYVQDAYVNVPLKVGGLTIPSMPPVIAPFTGARFGYVDASPVTKTLFELFQLPPLMPFEMGMALGKPAYTVDVPQNPALPKGVIEAIGKVSIVTRDVDATVRGYREQMGVDGWTITTLEDPVLHNASNQGKAYRTRVAQTVLNGTVLELVQPLEGASVYAEHLDKYGEGICALGVTTNGESWEKTLAQFAKTGCSVLQWGEWQGKYRFAMLDTVPRLCTLVEVLSVSADKLIASVRA